VALAETVGVSDEYPKEPVQGSRPQTGRWIIGMVIAAGLAILVIGLILTNGS
jgi:hypothetical protein